MATENPRVWFKSISLEDVRSFGTKQKINFTEDGTENSKTAQWNIILGDNGTGKTTVLKGIVYCFTRINVELKSLFQRGKYGDIPSRFKYTEEVKKNGSVTTSISTVSVNNRNGSKSSSDGIRNIMSTRAGSDYQKILFAYGAARRIGYGAVTQSEFYSKTDAELNSIITLFRDDKNLLNAEEWLVQSEYVALKEPQFEKQYITVLNVLKLLFRQEISDIYTSIELGVPKVFFKTHYGDVRLHELSLGYKTLIAWMVDFAKGLFDRYPDSENPLAEPAVCLVDEIDLHLHPKFQRQIIQFLTETFPNTQFIVTAHSPLIVQSAEDANIILLKREGDETHVADGIDVHSWRIDQILSSDLFGGIGGRSPKVEGKMARRRALLRKDERTPDEIRELDALEKEMNDLPVMETREALKAIDIISKAVISEK